MDQILAPAREGLERLLALLEAHSQVGAWYPALVRFLFPVLALLILVRAIRGLLRVPHAA